MKSNGLLLGSGSALKPLNNRRDGEGGLILRASLILFACGATCGCWRQKEETRESANNVEKAHPSSKHAVLKGTQGEKTPGATK